jgi:hypothetical protein
LPSGASCTNTTYVTGASSYCNDEVVHSMSWKSIETYTCQNGLLMQIGSYNGEGACSQYEPGKTITVNECPSNWDY